MNGAVLFYFLSHLRGGSRIVAVNRILLACIFLLISSPTFAQTYTVERVIDGNTIKLTNGERVRLIGIDTPESKPNAKAKRDSERTGKDMATITKMGQEATEFVKILNLEGKEVRLKFDVQAKDKYGRLLAYVYLNELYLPEYAREEITKVPPYMYYEHNEGHAVYYMLNAFLVKYGYATPMTIPPNVKHAELFKELYEEAREQKRGLWGETNLFQEKNYNQDADIVWNIYDSDNFRYDSLSLYHDLSPYGDKRAFEILKAFLFKDYQKQRMSTKKNGAFFHTILTIGLFASKNDEAFNFIQQILHPSFWKDNITWTSDMKDYVYEYLTSASIQTIGLSGRPEGKIILNQLKEKNKSYLHRFAGDIVQAAFYYHLYDEGGRKYLEKHLLSHDDTRSKWSAWKKTPSGKNWTNWGNEQMRGPRSALTDN